MKRKLEEDYYSEDAEEVLDEVETMEISDCSRCGAAPGFGGNPNNLGFTSCNIDEHSGVVTECNKCKDRMQ